MKYVAYGSNLSVKQMAHRCPHTKIVGTAVLKDWRLVFKFHADIEPCKGSEVPVLIWEITKSDEKRLDRYEGFPKYYVKKYLPEGMVYVMADGYEYASPSKSYLSVLIEGYRTFGFDMKILENAVSSCP